MTGFGFDIRSRAFIGGPHIKIVPVGIAGFSSATYKHEPYPDTIGITTIDYGELDLRMGIGLNYAPDDNNLFVAIIGFDRYKKSFKQYEVGDSTVIISSIPAFHVGAETRLSSWLVGRIGASQVYQGISGIWRPDSGDKRKTKSRFSRFEVNIGLAIIFRNIIVDLSLNEDLLFNGPYFISGSSEPLTNKISVTYDF